MKISYYFLINLSVSENDNFKTNGLHLCAPSAWVKVYTEY